MGWWRARAWTRSKKVWERESGRVRSWTSDYSRLGRRPSIFVFVRGWLKGKRGRERRCRRKFFVAARRMKMTFERRTSDAYVFLRISTSRRAFRSSLFSCVDVRVIFHCNYTVPEVSTMCKIVLSFMKPVFALSICLKGSSEITRVHWLWKYMWIYIYLCSLNHLGMHKNLFL